MTKTFRSIIRCLAVILSVLNFGHSYLPFDLAQGGELVEPFEICILVLGIFKIFIRRVT